MTQGELVYLAVLSVFGNDGKLDGPVPSTTQWTKDQTEKVHERILLGFLNGEVQKNSGGNDEISLKKYIPGLTNNWVRKDKRMNGGVTYAPKNPGSRTGSGDEQLKNLKVLLSVVTDPEAKLAVQAEIDKRLEELKPKVQLDISKLPEHLRAFVK